MIRALSLLLLGAGCVEGAPEPGWRLVGAYDAAALRALGDVSGAVDAWQPSAAMLRTCGPTKQADGLGFFEAEAMLAGHTPTLALLLERTGAGAGRPLSPADLRVSLGYGRPTAPLQPMVAPRRLGVTVTYTSTGPEAQEVPPEVGLVLTQLRAELCLEHKTGRAWIGGTRDQIRQAYLLDSPKLGDMALGGDRRYFVGQGAAVPAMAGPPDACLTLERPASRAPDKAPSAKDALAQPTQAKGQGSLDMTNTDIWGADLPTCDESPELPSYELPLRLSASAGQPPVRRPSSPRALRVTLDLGDQESPRVSLELNGASLLTNASLYGPETTADEGQERALVDLLAQVPLEYPALAPPDAEGAKDPYRYTVLLIPNWQIVEGLTALGRPPDSDASSDQGQVSGAPDAVGWVLRHPESLFVQVSSRATPGQQAGGEDEIWWSLGRGMVGEGWGARHWGFAVGHLFARQPIALPGGQEPTWPQTLEAHRAGAHALVFLSAACLLLVVGRGLARVRDLWITVPEERVTWWPGVQAQVPQPKPDALAKGEGT